MPNIIQIFNHAYTYWKPCHCTINDLQLYLKTYRKLLGYFHACFVFIHKFTAIKSYLICFVNLTLLIKLLGIFNDSVHGNVRYENNYRQNNLIISWSTLIYVYWRSQAELLNLSLFLNVIVYESYF